MELKNAEAWRKYQEANTDDYGKAILEYAERWADLMEKSMADGLALEDVAEKLSQTADIEGITGFMYGAAVKVLFDCWEHGELLRIWHNLKTQIGNEGEKGVLNPAILVVDKP